MSINLKIAVILQICMRQKIRTGVFLWAFFMQDFYSQFFQKLLLGKVSLRKRKDLKKILPVRRPQRTNFDRATHVILEQ